MELIHQSSLVMAIASVLIASMSRGLDVQGLPISAHLIRNKFYLLLFIIQITILTPFALSATAGPNLKFDISHSCMTPVLFRGHNFCLAPGLPHLPPDHFPHLLSHDLDNLGYGRQRVSR